MKPRIYKYDNVKALLIFLVVVGHMTTDYVSVSHGIRWFTLWIYTFHMPAFIFISGLMHKHYITEEQAALGVRGNTKMRWEKFIGFLLCGYALKFFIHIIRTLIGQHPNFYWIQEPGIPWYLIVLAEYELLLYLLRKVNWKVVLIAGFAVSAIIGYFPAVGDVLCLSRMINFFPIFMLGYYVDAAKLIEISENVKIKIASWCVIVASLLICYLGPWNMYSMRKWFTGRRSYEFLSDYFGNGIMPWAWAIRIGVWVIALLFTFAVIIVIPNKNLGYISIIGANTLNIYFWHRPICYWINGLGLFPALIKLCGNETIAILVFILVAVAMTALFGLDVFKHPAKDLTKIAENAINKKKVQEAK